MVCLLGKLVRRGSYCTDVSLITVRLPDTVTLHLFENPLRLARLVFVLVLGLLLEATDTGLGQPEDFAMGPEPAIGLPAYWKNSVPFSI